MLNSVGTISYFFPTLMTSLGYTGQKSQCEYREAAGACQATSTADPAVMTVPIYAVALVIALAVGFSADKTGQKAYHGIGACLLGVVSFVICATVSNNAVRWVNVISRPAHR
jgi:MFS family permease